MTTILKKKKKKPVCKHRSLSTPPLPRACAARHCQGPVIQGQLPSTSLGEHTLSIRLLQHHTGLCRRRLTPHSIPLPSPAWVSQCPLISCYFNPVLSAKNRRPQATYMQRRVQIQSWTPGAVRTKKRKRNLSQQPQEQWIKSPQSTWCTLHLWNTWIDNESSQNWGDGHWEQL